MGGSDAKLLIEKAFMDMQLNLENNYKEKAYDAYVSVSGMIESFYEQKEISSWAYKSYKRRMKKYDDIYNKQKDGEKQ